MRHDKAVNDAEPFDRAVRRRQRGRARLGEHGFLLDALADELVARLDGRRFARVLELGAHDGRLLARLGAAFGVALEAAEARLAGAPGCRVVADEDRLPFADNSFELVASLGSLHSVNDLPGALVLARRALVPGGLFMAAFAGGLSLAEERADWLAAEVALTGRAAARLSPMVDASAAAGLLQRAGFIDPVVDVETLGLRYASLGRALDELRGMGEGNCLARRAPLRRDVLAAAAARFAARAEADGRTQATVQILWLRGVAP